MALKALPSSQQQIAENKLKLAYVRKAGSLAEEGVREERGLS